MPFQFQLAVYRILFKAIESRRPYILKRFRRNRTATEIPKLAEYNTIAAGEKEGTRERERGERSKVQRMGEETIRVRARGTGLSLA